MGTFIILIIISFFIGSTPSGYLVGKYLGKDIRKEGSGNTGATNTARALGKKAGLVTLAADLVKGMLPSLIPVFYSVGQLKWSGASGTTQGDLQACLGLAAIIGHCYSPFLFFKGGKGVATTLGAFIVIAPIQAVLAVACFALIVKQFRIVSLGSVVAVLFFVLLIMLDIPTTQGGLTKFASMAMGFLVISRHKANIYRIIEGTEPRFKLPEGLTKKTETPIESEKE